ncbi:hypothetical protein [Caenimonas sp. SL110]|uniref:hypothetical protein n=1 Tax=Caenimonas sp. SL110 TaxID=1450524 RepID=UPI0006537DA1|nr:hypothetical protein [Caenimonas sp. SL110]
MRVVLALIAAAFVSGCAVVPPQAWSYDPTQPQPKPVIASADAVALSERTAQLQLQRNEIRTRIANEPNVWMRQVLYAQLHAVGMQLSPLERRVARYDQAR